MPAGVEGPGEGFLDPSAWLRTGCGWGLCNRSSSEVESVIERSRIGHREKSIGHQEKSIGHQEKSIGHQEKSIGHRAKSR
jgi:hypothetical protein